MGKIKAGHRRRSERLGQRAASGASIRNSAGPLSAVAQLQGRYGNATLQRMYDAGMFQGVAVHGPVQAKKIQPARNVSPPSAAQEGAVNPAGLPGKLKSGLETLSGISMDHVKVHYNSPKPLQMKAHAYTQGSDIHISPGQERHLPHEGWHVVQQAQGRVKATLQAKGAQLNDDPALEKEADLMGYKATCLKEAPPGNKLSLLNNKAGTGNAFPIQRAAHSITYDQPDKVNRNTTNLKKNNLLGSDTIAEIKHDRKKFPNPPAGMDRDEAKSLSGWSEVPEPGAKCNHSRAYASTKDNLIGRYTGKKVSTVVNALYVTSDLLDVDHPSERAGKFDEDNFGKRNDISNWIQESIARICNRTGNLFYWPATHVDDEASDDWAVEYNPETINKGAWKEKGWDQTKAEERGRQMGKVNDRLKGSRDKIDSII